MKKRRLFGAGLLVSAVLSVPLRAAAKTAAAAATTTTTEAAAAAAAAASSIAPPISASVETRLTLRLVYAALLGAGLGKERSYAKHSAGVRTMALVSMGAAAYTVVSAYGFAFAGVGRYDPGRMASQVASGVGFVGAGVITTQSRAASESGNGRGIPNVVHGLTSAVAIWISAAVGVACGVGLLQIATVSSVAAITILRLGRRKPSNLQIVQTRLQPTKERREVAHAPTTARRDAVDNVDYADTHDTGVWDEDNEDNDESHHGVVVWTNSSLTMADVAMKNLTTT